MSYLFKVLMKIVLLPVVIVIFVPAYLLFIIDPDCTSFKFKWER